MIITRRCGTCKYWHTERGYECQYAGPYGGDLQDKIIHPYCKWALSLKGRIRVLLGKDELKEA